MMMMPVAVCVEGVVGTEQQLASHPHSQAVEDLVKVKIHSQEKSNNPPGCGNHLKMHGREKPNNSQAVEDLTKFEKNTGPKRSGQII